MINVLIILSVLCFSAFGQDSNSDKRAEDAALCDIIASTNIVDQLGWNCSEISSMKCSWLGISCDEGGNVTSLQLDSSATTITLTGTLPISLGNLSSLERISIFSTTSQLVGTLPSSIHLCTRLTYLRIDGSLTGPIPDIFENMTALVEVRLNGNYFTSTIPSSFSRLSNLQHLGLSSNRLTGSVPDMFHNMSELVDINLFYNRYV